MNINFLLIGVLCWGAAAFAEMGTTNSPPQPTVFFPKTSFTPEDLAVIVNDDDPLSIQIAQYYQARRNIPDKNIIHVSFRPDHAVMSQVEFSKIKAVVNAKTPKSVQAFALTWRTPFRVDCMSITTAFAAGFDKKFCAQGCSLTKPLPYFNSPSRLPYKDFSLRPTMSLAGASFEEVKKLIDRGIQSDYTYPDHTGYLVDTNDKDRNVRSLHFGSVARYMSKIVKMEHIKENYIENKSDVLFYFTGLSNVPALSSNTFLPGAIADHLTSTGGVLAGENNQMSSLRWLEAGATGSYGAVVEPCNFPTKFPNPGVVISRYTNGETLIESYWKSVVMPGQGIFIGEPLANPYGGYKTTFSNGNLTIHTQALPQGAYAILSADSGIGPYHLLARGVPIGIGMQEIKVKNAKDLFYRIVQEDRRIP